MPATHPSVVQPPVHASSSRLSSLPSTVRPNRTTVSPSLHTLTFFMATTIIALFFLIGALSGLVYEVQRTHGMCARAVVQIFA